MACQLSCKFLGILHIKSEATSKTLKLNTKLQLVKEIKNLLNYLFVGYNIFFNSSEANSRRPQHKKKNSMVMNNSDGGGFVTGPGDAKCWPSIS